MKTFLLAAILAAVAVLAIAQSKNPVIYQDSNFATTAVMEPQAVPIALTVVFHGRSMLAGGWISCGTLQSITIKDGNGKALLDGVPVAKNSTISLAAYAGDIFPVSISIMASGPGCTYSLRAHQ